MADKDDTSKVPPDRNSDPTRVSAETSTAGDHSLQPLSSYSHRASHLNKSVEDLDSVRIRPMIEELVFKAGDRVEDSGLSYWR